MMKFKQVFALLFVALLLMAAPALAAKHTMGLGVGVTSEYEGSDDTEGVPLILFSGNYDSGRSFNLFNTRLFVNVLTTEGFQFGPVLNYRPGRDDVDNQVVDNMVDIDDAFEAGVYGGYKAGDFIIGLEVLTDVSDEHEGTLANVVVDYVWKASDDLTLTPGVFATYASDDYMDTYFGVNADNVGTSGLPLYKAEAGVKDAGINLVAIYKPWTKWGLMGVATYKSLLGDAEDSPIVEAGDDSRSVVGVVATYSWE